jgi:hypothetical protein
MFVRAVQTNRNPHSLSVLGRDRLSRHLPMPVGLAVRTVFFLPNPMSHLPNTLFSVFQSAVVAHVIDSLSRCRKHDAPSAI